MNDPSQMMNRSFGIWQPRLPPLPRPTNDPMGFQKPRPVFTGTAAGRPNWKVKKPPAAAGVGAGDESQYQSRYNPRRFFPKKKHNRFAPFAPRNTTSFIIRAKKSGGIASLVSPCPVTPAILPTPRFSPSREGLVDMAKEEWGVDGYGSMKGLIRLRESKEEDDELVEEDGNGSSESEVEEHVEVERRLDHDLSRFEMVYPRRRGDEGYDDDDDEEEEESNIVRLAEENVMLKERLFLMEREMGEIRRRLQSLERHCRHRRVGDGNRAGDDVSGENSNNNGEDGGGDVCSENSVDRLLD
ncbi:uncharacterized protein [Typha latifolia]|uniref:uncharacterized protein n=1 Tax=Typha latifolia TaxID=4733 RepID=UPI003C30A491